MYRMPTTRRHDDHTDGGTHTDSHGDAHDDHDDHTDAHGDFTFKDHTDGGHADHLDTSYHTDHIDTSSYSDHLDKRPPRPHRRRVRPQGFTGVR